MLSFDGFLRLAVVLEGGQSLILNGFVLKSSLRLCASRQFRLLTHLVVGNHLVASDTGPRNRK